MCHCVNNLQDGHVDVSIKNTCHLRVYLESRACYTHCLECCINVVCDTLGQSWSYMIARQRTDCYNNELFVFLGDITMFECSGLVFLIGKTDILMQ